MKGFFFLRLAVDGMKKNRQIYVPYLLTCVGTVAMFYILQSLSYSPLLEKMKGGGSTQICLSLGKFVIAVFSVLFLWYSNSFLSKRRGKEFGLYNILGMGKRGLRKIMLWESLMVTAIGVIGGLFFGFLLSKFAELGLANALKITLEDYSFVIKGNAFLFTVEIYACIFALLYLRNVIKVQLSNPLDLFHSVSHGEKPPKANWLLALLGLLLLGAAYATAVSIQAPLAALFLFFIAVIAVIIATYLLFIAGSVVLCRLLKNNKKYYYQKRHFVSVSSMIFRMRRNGAGLASICILSTMVLVMLSSTGSLYFGMDDAMEKRFFRDSEVSLNFYGETKAPSEEKKQRVLDVFHKEFDKLGVTPENEISYAYVMTEGVINGSEVDLGASYNDEMSAFFSADAFRGFYFLDVKEYNKIVGTDLSVAPGEAWLYANDCQFSGSSLCISGITWRIGGFLEKSFPLGEDEFSIFPSLTIVVSDLNELEDLWRVVMAEDYWMSLRWYYGYDLDASDELASKTHMALRNSIGRDDLMAFLRDEDGGYSYFSSCKSDEMKGFVDLYGGLFFLGILLSIAFLFAAVLIIYYKQITEGFEDQGRFEIMQKVGMTTKDIKSSINSQVLTVFFAPLLMAGLHLAFAYPMIWKVLKLFGLINLGHVIFVTLIIFLAFTVFYVAVYKWTAGTYYRIVNGNRKAK